MSFSGATLWGYGVDPRSIPNDFIPPLAPGAYPTETQWASDQKGQFATDTQTDDDRPCRRIS